MTEKHDTNIKIYYQERRKHGKGKKGKMCCKEPGRQKVQKYGQRKIKMLLCTQGQITLPGNPVKKEKGLNHSGPFLFYVIKNRRYVAAPINLRKLSFLPFFRILFHWSSFFQYDSVSSLDWCAARRNFLCDAALP